MTAAYQLRGLRYDYGSQRVLQGLDVFLRAGEKPRPWSAQTGPERPLCSKLLAVSRNTGWWRKSCFKANHLPKNSNSAYARKVGLVQQNPYLLQGSVLSNVEIGLRLRGHDKAARLERALDVHC